MLTVDEVQKLLSLLDGEAGLLARLLYLYSSGMRLMH